MYHFIGIKGAGMASLAQIMKELGYEVQGSDLEKHFFTEEGLRKLEIPVFPFDEKNIQKGMKIIRGASFKDDHPEVQRALELGLNMYTYSEMVGKLTQKFKTICIAGCHGKTTTTSMMAHVLNPLKGANYLIGDGTGYASVENEYFVLEACEYRRHFLHYTPTYAIITNIDLDHVDYFKDIDDVIDAYREYANNAEKMIIACGDDPYTHSLEVNKPIFFYGIHDDNDIKATDIEYKSTGTSFDVIVEDNYYGHFDLPIYGKHMLLDALAVIGVCYYERLEAREVSKIFKTFSGAKRRFSETKIGDYVVIDDYAHHPNEVKALLSAVKQKYGDKKLIGIFQPHTFSRTQEFANDLVKVFKNADKAYILDIHPAREKQEDFEDVTSHMIINELENGFSLTMDDASKLIETEPTVYVFMSPNDIVGLENDLIALLKEITAK